MKSGQVGQAMAFGRLQERGQVTIPLKVRREAGFEPGDVILFQVVERGCLQAVALPRHASMDKVLARFGTDGSLDPEVWERAGEDIARDALDSAEVEGGRRG